MKKQWTYLRTYFILFLTALALSSCESDDDWMMRESISGIWRLVEVEDYSGNSPYRPNDRLNFRYDGVFESRGSQGFEEYGYWDVGRDVITIDFDGDGRSDLVAQVLHLEDSYMVLDVTDYGYECNYRLRMLRY